MNSATQSRQGQRILQIGVALLLFSSLEGFAIPYFAVPKLGLSVHTLALCKAFCCWRSVFFGPGSI